MSKMPNWEGFIVPILRVLDDGTTRHRRELQPLVADEAKLTDEQKIEMLASGRRLKYADRVGWAASFLTIVGGLTRPSRGHYQITEAGRTIIDLFPQGAREKDIKLLGEDPNSPILVYQSTVSRNKGEPTKLVEADDNALTPTEQVQIGIERIHQEIVVELLERLQGSEPGFFEQAVVDLLLAMGYGGTTGAGNVTQLSNDGGIDGVIDQDILGLNRVYIQAKRYANHNAVGRPDLQAFVGALSGKADSGVFITTSRFADTARDYASNVPTRIILLDGERLTSLMIRYGVGVQVQETYKVVKIDEDFFA